MRSRFLFLCCASWLFANCAAEVSAEKPDDNPFVLSASDINRDPLTGKRYNAVIKVSTLQVLFSEAPFSAEVFTRNDLSMQLQVGIIFPMKEGSFLEEYFRSGGRNATASASGLISYRNSPFNSHGLSFKYEVRKYSGKYYYAPQVMYKYTYFDNTDFPVMIGGKPWKQNESKRQKTAGLGIMVGRQTYFMRQATDWYAGFGIRARYLSSTVNEIVDPVNPDMRHMTGEQTSRWSVYPFINFGFRTGLVL